MRKLGQVRTGRGTMRPVASVVARGNTAQKSVENRTADGWRLSARRRPGEGCEKRSRQGSNLQPSAPEADALSN